MFCGYDWEGEWVEALGAYDEFGGGGVSEYGVGESGGWEVGLRDRVVVRYTR